MKALGKRPDIPPRFLFLWRVPKERLPEEFIPQLLRRIGCNGCVEHP